jgi:hypothetical protein
MDCSVDWAATGSMLTAFGTFAGAGAVVFAAIVGSRTFEGWRRQQQEQRRMDAAEKIMTLTYRLKDDLESVRSPTIYGYEIEAAAEELKEVKDWWAGLSPAAQHRASVAHSRIIRMRHYKADWDEIWVLRPLARAYFGEAVDRPLHLFWKKHVEVMAAAEALREDNGSDRDFSRKMRATTSSAANPDELGREVREAVEQLERNLLPVLRADFQPAASVGERG